MVDRVHVWAKGEKRSPDAGAPPVEAQDIPKEEPPPVLRGGSFVHCPGFAGQDAGFPAIKEIQFSRFRMP